MTNEEIVAKAIITTDALAAAGLLGDEQADQFIDYVIDVTELRGSVRVVRFRAQNLDIDKIGVGQRVTVPKSEARDPGIRRGVTTSKVTLTPQELMTPFEISDNFAENNLQGEDVEDTIIRMMATQTANDIEEMLVNADVLGPARLEDDLEPGGSTTQVIRDPLMRLMDGWLRLMDSGNVYDATGASISLRVFSAIIRTLPVKFRRTRRNLRFFISMDLEQLWREKVSARMTAKGDDAMASSSPIPVFGVPLIPVPLMDSNPRIVQHVTLGAAPASVTLRYQPIVTSAAFPMYVTLSTLAGVPTTPFVETTDYTIDDTTGVLTTVALGAMAAGGTYKVTYHAVGQVALADQNNLIMGIGRDIRIESQREIFKGLNQFAITTKVDAEIEEVTATVKGINIALT